MQRWIELDGVVNMRDLGGLPTRDGGVVQPRRLIRSDNLQDLTPADVRHLIDDIGVSDIVDLRSHRELHLTGDGPLRATPLRHHHHSFFPDPTPDPEGEQPSPPARPAAAERPPVNADYWSQHYRGYLNRRPDSVAAALSVIATAPGATIVHCAAGKDRTGTVIGLALSVAGVPREEIVADYILSTERLEQIVGRLVVHEAYRELLTGRPITDQEPLAESMEQLLDMVEDDFGGAPAWLRAQGWTAGEVAALRSRLLAP
ncbi:MAG: tyrosine-protein phosphatase [Tetrasphaera sp.]